MGRYKIALIGNPNMGKTSLFNLLTGLKQKVGNYPGITVERKTGKFTHQEVKVKLLDLPGTYSLYPSSADEEVAFEVLANPEHKDHPDAVWFVADASHLPKSLPLFMQIKALGKPTVLILNMWDEAMKKGVEVDLEKLETITQSQVVCTNGRKGEGIDELKSTLIRKPVPEPFIVPFEMEPREAITAVKRKMDYHSRYAAWHALALKNHPHVSRENADFIAQVQQEHQIIPRRLQVKEAIAWKDLTQEWLTECGYQVKNPVQKFTRQVDKIVLHPIGGYVIFFALLLLVFQAIFSWSELPMTWIEEAFGWIQTTVKSSMSEGPLTSLLADGIIAGLGGIVVFIPQIVILFFFILCMEESGYMSRVVLLMDRWMKPFGLHGKSVVPLISGAACAVPAVMSARNIEHRKERLITQLVTPFMTCSARLPVYTLIISLVIPDTSLGWFNVQALALLGLYLLGIVVALGFAFLLKLILRSAYKSYLILELPVYRFPLLKNIGIQLWEKVFAFIWGAGKIILALSIVLWVLASFGPGEKFSQAAEFVESQPELSVLSPEEKEAHVASIQLENSYLGILGRGFEPVIRPLGYDWKMGIGIIASFAAREVFVPTMATIYSVGDVDDESSLREKMANDKLENGESAYSLASGVSLLLFYALAMMCMSTVAIVKRETGGWKWALIQFAVMTALAYIVAFIAYQLLT